MMQGEHKWGWYGFDLDATLAHYDRWRGAQHIGEPIPKAVAKVKEHLAAGHTVKLLTARDRESYGAIADWCKKHIGQSLPITDRKDMGLIKLYDDRADHMFPNTGVTASERIAELEAEVSNLQARLRKAVAASRVGKVL